MGTLGRGLCTPARDGGKDQQRDCNCGTGDDIRLALNVSKPWMVDLFTLT